MPKQLVMADRICVRLSRNDRKSLKAVAAWLEANPKEGPATPSGAIRAALRVTSEALATAGWMASGIG